MKIGILGLQGAIEEHERAVLRAANNLNIEISHKRVILPEEIENIDGLIMPGGESTAMILIGEKNGMLHSVRNKIKNGLPVFGTCAGAILLSKRVRRNLQTVETEGAFPYLNIDILRNGYGRQVDSFSTLLQISKLNKPFEGIFIRAPRIVGVGDNVEVISTTRNDPVLIKQNNILASTFHPELAVLRNQQSDSRIHEIFLKMVQNH